MTFDTNLTATNGSESSNAMDVGGQGQGGNFAQSIYIALENLFLSPENIRKSKATHIEQLAAMIASQGLLAPLHVIEELDDFGKVTGRYAVQAGGRRYRALMLLCEQGKFTPSSLIECKMVHQTMALEVGLAENLGQQPMHPADEFAAFQGLIDEGKTTEEVSIAFGVSELHVKRRLRLASVATELMQLFRDGGITLDVMMAFASNADQERQLAVWNSLGEWERKNIHVIKGRLKEEAIAQDDPRVKVIGLQTYLAAGGQLDADLFSDDQSKPSLVDVGLVELLLGEAVQPVVEAVTEEGWAWVRVIVDFGAEQKRIYKQLPPTYREATEQEQHQRKALEARRLALCDEIDALEGQEDVDYDQVDQKVEAIEAIEAEQSALECSLIDPSGFDKAVSGAIVTVTGEGIEVLRGIVEQSRPGQPTSVSTPEVVKAPKADIPETLMKNLTSHRTAAVQAELLGQQGVALAALAAGLMQSVTSVYVGDCPQKVRLDSCEYSLKNNSDTLAQSPAAVLLAERKKQLLARLPSETEQWFSWFHAQPLETVLEYLTFAAAISTNLIEGTERMGATGTDLMQALGLDMTKWWTAGPATYFDLVPKSKLEGILVESGCPQAAAELGKMKKADAVVHMVKHMEGKGWLPSPLRVLPKQPAPAAA